MKYKSLGFILFVSYALVLFLLITIYIIAKQNDIPIANFTGDPALIANAPFYIGFLSNIGIMLWSFTSSICFFLAVILFKIKKTEEFGFFLLSGLFTLILLIDDLFMVHDQIFPRYFHISGNLVYLTYFVLMIILFIKYGKYIILHTEYFVFIIALIFFALSIVFDLFMDQSHTSINYLIEDGLKLFGIITWFIFFSRTSYKQLIYSIF